MKNLTSLAGKMACLALALFAVVACSDDETPSYTTNTLSADSELKAILEKMGYTFNEDGNLLLDDLANNTTTLDLSGTNISQSALAELSILPNLTDVNLANNGYGDTFDFANLPAQVTSVDLTGNEIYNYDNLVKVTVEENGDETVENLRTITKLYLPETAKNNIAQLMRFYRQNKDAIDDGTMDVKMANASGTLETYNTLREVPDETLRAYLKEQFADLFDGDKINIANYILDVKQKINPIRITSNVKDFDGIQYVVQNPYWQGASIAISAQQIDTQIPALNLSNYVNTITLLNVSVEEINLPEKSILRYIWLANVSNLRTIDLSKSSVFGQRTAEEELDATVGSAIIVYDCADLEDIILPEKESLRINYLIVECLPKLRTFELSKFIQVNNLNIGDLADSYNLVYPNLQEFDETENEATMFNISENSYQKYNAETDAFIKKYYKASPSRLVDYGYLYSSNNDEYDWADDY